MAKPTTLPRWANVAGNILAPNAALQDTGWVDGAIPTAKALNWLLRWNYEWAKYVQGLEAEALTWTARHTFQVDGAGWQLLTLAAGWQIAFIGQEPQFRIDSFGRVWMRGVAMRVSGSGPLVDALPAAAIPPGNRTFAAFVNLEGTSVGSIGRINVTPASGVPAGRVSVSNVGGGAIDQVRLDGVAYYTT